MTSLRLIHCWVVVGCFQPAGGPGWPCRGEEYCSIVVADWFDHLPPLDDIHLSPALVVDARC